LFSFCRLCCQSRRQCARKSFARHDFKLNHRDYSTNSSPSRPNHWNHLTHLRLGRGLTCPKFSTGCTLPWTCFRSHISGSEQFWHSSSRCRSTPVRPPGTASFDEEFRLGASNPGPIPVSTSNTSSFDDKTVDASTERFVEVI
jgi:hypothetical protein